MTNAKPIVPLSLKDHPSLIERLLPVQRLSAEAYKEQMAVHGKTLTALGSYWKGRKPLILNKACVLGCLLPATDDPARDLEVFEKLLGMDDESFAIRSKNRPKPKEILASLVIPRIADYFAIGPEGILPTSAPVDWSQPEYDRVKVVWRTDITDLMRRRLEAQMLPQVSYRERVDQAQRPEEVMLTIHNHVWDAVNAHLGTSAQSFPELVQQLGIMRYGHRPRVADTFCGSGQIPFEAARLGCDVYASDLNPMACMLTWGAFNIVGGSEESREKLATDQQELVRRVQAEIDQLGVETDGSGWRAKVFLYCVEVRCPQTGWMVPLLPSLVVSSSRSAVAQLVPDPIHRRYDIQIRVGVSAEELDAAQIGTIGRDSKFDEAFLIHHVDGVKYKTKISTLRGDIQKPDGTIENRLRLWERLDFKPRPDDLLQERLYCIQWMRPKEKGKGEEYQFRTVTHEDLLRERIVEEHVAQGLAEWQKVGWVPDTRIEVGGPPRYQGLDLIRARGWTHWHHLFNPRQLLVAGLVNRFSDARLKFGLTQVLNWNSRLCIWSVHDGGGGAVKNTFMNQALNTLYNYGCRGFGYCRSLLDLEIKSFQFAEAVRVEVNNASANQVSGEFDIFLTDPPYGDAVKYEEILDFFIGWLRKNPPREFADWIWDSRRSLAIKGEDEDFRRNMVTAYGRMTECMPDNGIQVIMFTHQSGSIWADMANIVWASGLRVTAAWYVVTETASAMREGSHVKGTILLVLRKRRGIQKTTRDDLAWDIKEEVESQVATLTGLNQKTRLRQRDENIFADADLQMAGYAAALRVLTQYSVIDGKDMVTEAVRPRVGGQKTFVDELIEFAVGVANQSLVPAGIEKAYWDRLQPAERFYLKLLELESVGIKTLDNYQNFAKAFKVADFKPLMASNTANAARLKSATELARGEMGDSSELANTPLRAVLYAIMELVKGVDGSEVLSHLGFNIDGFYNPSVRDTLVELAEYLAAKLAVLRADEASAARVLRELIKSQKM